MVPFLIGLLAVVSVFAQSGKPANTPPHVNDEVSVRGEAVSEAAIGLEPKSENEVPDEESSAGDEDTSTIEEKSEVEVLGAEEDAAVGAKAQAKVASYNTKSGKDMPTTVPQVAVDNSVALSISAETEGEEADSSNTGTENSGKAFGQASADAARNRGN